MGVHIDMQKAPDPSPIHPHIDIPPSSSKPISICLPREFWAVSLSISICSSRPGTPHIDMQCWVEPRKKVWTVSATTFSYELRLSRFKLRWIRIWIFYNIHEEKILIWKMYWDVRGLKPQHKLSKQRFEVRSKEVTCLKSSYGLRFEWFKLRWVRNDILHVLKSKNFWFGWDTKSIETQNHILRLFWHFGCPKLELEIFYRLESSYHILNGHFRL